LEADFAHFYPNEDVGTLWRSRRWRRLLNLIDKLPRNTHYHQAVLADPEHLAMLDRVRAKGDPGPAPLPPLATWSAEVDMGANIRDAILELKDVLVRVNTDKKNQGKLKPVTWTARPGRAQTSDLSTLSSDEKLQTHARLVGKLLPHKA
jgi:hypothetical protein